ncbi:MAG: hypothetical protein EA425_09550 [Puniceicoccaceae bacterium]|nr:MAG: hypothetical protein EA425_09550 [Puniceicoccaceae bacterium]
MDSPRLYLSLIPESLVFSMLPPEDFGKYLAIGPRRLSKGQAVFFEVDPSFKSDYFKLEAVRERCVRHADGSVRRSSYVSVYRVLENVPLTALGDLYLTTRTGDTLRLTSRPFEGDGKDQLFLYQEFCPVNPRVASSLDPAAFGRHVTDPGQPVYLPRLVFADLKLHALAVDPVNADSSSLPYPEILHLRECLVSLRQRPEKRTKIVNRDLRQEILFAMIRSGIFVAEQDGLLFYPLPDEDDLRRDHFSWWQSASTASRL